MIYYQGFANLCYRLMGYASFTQEDARGVEEIQQPEESPQNETEAVIREDPPLLTPARSICVWKWKLGEVGRYIGEERSSQKRYFILLKKSIF